MLTGSSIRKAMVIGEICPPHPSPISIKKIANQQFNKLFEFRILDHGCRVLDPAPGSWIQDPGSRIQGPGSRRPDPGSRIPDPGSRTQDPGSRTLGSGSRFQDPDPGPWSLNSGFRIQDPKSRIIDAGCRILDPGSWISRTLLVSGYCGYPGGSQWGQLPMGVPLIDFMPRLTDLPCMKSGSLIW